MKREGRKREGRNVILREERKEEERRGEERSLSSGNFEKKTRGSEQSCGSGRGVSVERKKATGAKSPRFHADSSAHWVSASRDCKEETA